MKHTISNEFLSLTVDEMGSAVCSVRDADSGYQYVWQPDPASWNRSDLIMFPVIGKGDMLINGVRRRFQRQHGCLQDMRFSPTRREPEALTLHTAWNSQTLAVFPYRFTFASSYQLEGRRLVISYLVSCEDGAMPFQLGNHLGISLPGGGGQLRFEKAENLVEYVEAGGELRRDESSLGNITHLDIADVFSRRSVALSFSGVQSREFLLESRYGALCRYRIASPLIRVWKHQVGDFLCVEPTWGLPSRWLHGEFDRLPMINVAGSEPACFAYSIAFLPPPDEAVAVQREKVGGKANEQTQCPSHHHRPAAI